MRKMKNDEKKLVLRILMLILAVSMILGYVLLPLGQSATASAEGVTEVEVASFTTGGLAAAIETAKDGTDLNNVTGITVSGGTLSAADYQAICGYPNIIVLDLSGAKTEGGVIPPSALASRNQLSVVYLPSDTKEIGEGALSGNRSLTEIYMPSTVRIIGAHAFEGCEKVEHFDIPAETEEIGEYAFSDCKALSDFVLPAGITAVPDRCFDKTSLKMLIMGPQVTQIGAGAFENCHDLADICFYGDTAPSAPSGAFQNCKVTFHMHEDAEGAENIADTANGMVTVAYDLEGEYKAPVNESPAQPAEEETQQTTEVSADNDDGDEENTGTVITARKIEPDNVTTAAPAADKDEKSSSGGVSVAAVIIIAVLCAAVGVFATLFFTSKKKIK